MTIYDSEKHHRKSIRLQDYDYSASGFYFVTICIKNMECLFGNIVNSIVNLSDFGVIASNLWQEIPDNFDGVEIDEFIIMPNHIHGIIKITSRGLINQTPTLACNQHQTLMIPTTHTLIPNELESNISGANNLMKSDKYLLGKIIRYFKAKTTKKIRDNNFYFQWQKNYYEHIIKSEESLNSIRIYILNNPSRWILEEKNKIEGY